MLMTTYIIPDVYQCRKLVFWFKTIYRQESSKNQPSKVVQINRPFVKSVLHFSSHSLTFAEWLGGFTVAKCLCFAGWTKCVFFCHKSFTQCSGYIAATSHPGHVPGMSRSWQLHLKHRSKALFAHKERCWHWAQTCDLVLGSLTLISNKEPSSAIQLNSVMSLYCLVGAKGQDQALKKYLCLLFKPYNRQYWGQVESKSQLSCVLGFQLTSVLPVYGVILMTYTCHCHCVGNGSLCTLYSLWKWA